MIRGRITVSTLFCTTFRKRTCESIFDIMLQLVTIRFEKYFFYYNNNYNINNNDNNNNNNNNNMLVPL